MHSARLKSVRSDPSEMECVLDGTALFKKTLKLHGTLKPKAVRRLFEESSELSRRDKTNLLVAYTRDMHTLRQQCHVKVRSAFAKQARATLDDSYKCGLGESMGLMQGGGGGGAGGGKAKRGILIEIMNMFDTQSILPRLTQTRGGLAGGVAGGLGEGDSPRDIVIGTVLSKTVDELADQERASVLLQKTMQSALQKSLKEILPESCATVVATKPGRRPAEKKWYQKQWYGVPTMVRNGLWWAVQYSIKHPVQAAFFLRLASMLIQRFCDTFRITMGKLMYGQPLSDPLTTSATFNPEMFRIGLVGAMSTAFTGPQFDATFNLIQTITGKGVTLLATNFVSQGAAELLGAASTLVSEISKDAFKTTSAGYIYGAQLSLIWDELNGLLLVFAKTCWTGM